MKFLKDFRYILFIFALVFTVNVGYSNTTEKEKKSDGQEQEQEGRRKSDQGMMRPDSGSATEAIDQELQEELEEEVEDSKTPVYQSIEKIDSAKEESVSKYNFIFYFLYKFKYDGEEAP